MVYLFKQMYYIFLKLSKCIGLFKVAKTITSKKVRILCYHNFSSDEDLVKWRPTLHIKPETFRKRIEYVKRSNYSIVGLDDAVQLLKTENNSLNLPLVITIDDGWSSILKIAHPVLRAAFAKYTVYLTSWYCKNNYPVYNLIVPFVLWKATKNGFDLKKLSLPFETTDHDLSDSNHLSDKIINFGIQKLSIDERYELLRNICSQVMFDYDSLEKNKCLSLVDVNELGILIKDGVDIQLHTHTHNWPLDEGAADAQLSKNRLFIESATNNTPDHFCYPSGIWNESQFKYLEKNKIKSATTCDSGLNSHDTNTYILHRFLDSEDIPQIVFEAYLSGFMFILKKTGIFKISTWLSGKRQ